MIYIEYKIDGHTFGITRDGIIIAPDEMDNASSEFFAAFR